MSSADVKHTSHDIPTWDILDNYFNNSGGSDSANVLVKHQIESYNEFLDKKLVQIIQGFNSIQIFHNYNEEIGDFMYKININILQPSITKPMYQTQDGSQMLMTPHLARMNNLTYATNLYVDIHTVTDVINKDGVTERNENTVPSVCIGRIPMMVRSKGCVLTQMPNLADGDGKHECRYDPGGYFVINGNEKVVICQDRISENKTLVFAPTTNSDGLSAEIRSMPDGVFLPPKTTSIHLSAKPNHLGHLVRMNTTFLRSEIPVFTMFRALGIEKDRDIISYIVFDIESPKNQRMMTELMACCEDGSDVHTQEDAQQILLKMIGTSGTPREYLEKPEVARQILHNMISNDFLPHVGTSFRRKALYLGYMMRKLFRIFLGYQDYDNRDSYLHKRIDTTGVLMSNLFRQCYSKMVKEMRNLVTRELNLWRANSDTHTNLITPNNVHKFFKPTLLETGLRYALSTGNWGVKTIGTFQNIRQGVAQVLNRMSYLSTLSHLRRINTPMEKSGKLVQPRKLENSQFGMICPAECFDPETPILLWNGMIKKANEIMVGDYLIDDKGNAVRVKSTCSGNKMMYEIIPTKKNFMCYTVTDNHILTLKVKRYKGVSNHREKKRFTWFDKKELKYKYKYFDNENELRIFESEMDNDNVIDITIEKYLSLSKYVQDNLYTFKSSGINWEHKDVALDPYMLGMWLGDGLSCGYGFVTADKELLEQWVEWGKNNDATIKHSHRYGYYISSTINNTQTGIACNKTESAPLKKLLAKYNLVKNKHIPLDYLVNDRKTRLALLAGIIDTDGNVRANGHEIRICQGEANYQIIYDTEFLARSLGFSCHLNDGICTYTVNDEKRKRPYKELTITGQYLYEIPTVLPRKKLNKFDNPVSEKKCPGYLQSRFELVQKDIQEFVGWQLEGNGRFLLGDMSTVHNTPEGSAVGLVKNMAMSTQITISMSSTYIRACIMDLGVQIMTDAIDHCAARQFIKNMGSDSVVHVSVNGDLVGYHPEPHVFYAKIKSLKRQGVIAPTTGIVWDIRLGCIVISTEAGRLCRPLYIVDEVEASNPSVVAPVAPIPAPVKKGRGKKATAVETTPAVVPEPISMDTKRVLRLPPERGNEWKTKYGFKSFIEYVAPLHAGKDIEGFIEFMDTDEIDKAMIAMTPRDLERGIEVTTLPPCYTHCEIHPSLMNGVLAVNIPFSDHNQSPRNCYQCLWEESPVLMAEGGWKRIKDVAPGDHVVCFHPQTMAPSITRVVHQYCRPNLKTMGLLVTCSGRSLFATRDHKIMTNRGWLEMGEFMVNADTAYVGVQAGIPDITSWGAHITNDLITRDVVIPMNSLDNGTQQRLTEMGLFPLSTNNPKMPILCRMLGWYIQKGKFQHTMDSDSYHDDARYLGFIQYGGNDTALNALLVCMGNTIKEWISNTSVISRKELFAGYIGARDQDPDVYTFDEWVMEAIPSVIAFAESLHNENMEYSLLHMFGCRYNTVRLLAYAIRDEYVNYKKYITLMKINDKVISLERWMDIVKGVGNVIFVPVLSCKSSSNRMISDITVESDNHSFIGGDCITVSNSAMGKQAVGVYMSNFNHRIDTMAHVLNYPQRPLVHTRLSKYTNSDTIPAGVNAVVAIMTYTGFNMEDSVMVNQSALDRGLFTSTYYKSYRDQCNKNHSTGEEEIFTSPDPMTTSHMKPCNYEKLGEDGFVPKNTAIDINDILVGKIMPHKVHGVIYPRDTSMGVKANDEGYVDMNYTGSNGEGYKFCKVRLRKYRKPMTGDKLASRHAQKGTIGMIYPQEDMPFTKDGIVPDVILNPHAIPSRMTIAQLMECIMGKSCSLLGTFGDATPFTDCTVEDIASTLEKFGMERYGNEIMYHGRTGNQIKTEIFIGPTFYQRLKHMVTDKMFSRGSNGPVVLLTRQPAEGRARNGGLRFGEMERDAMVSHGSSCFLKERLLDCSDNYSCFVCKQCGLLANVNRTKNLYNCPSCKNSADITEIRIPYSMKLLLQELLTMGVAARIAT